MIFSVKSCIGAAALLMSTSSLALSEERTWTGTIETSYFDCKLEKIDKIIVSGIVKLVHPEDRDFNLPPKKIEVFCSNISFLPGSVLNTVSDLDIRISDVTAGPVKIHNTRGQKGADAPETADPNNNIWQVRKMPKGADGAAGGGGRDAKKCIEVGHGSDRGGNGARGADGDSGLNFTAPKGVSGKNGTSGGDVVLVTRIFADGTTVDIQSSGGDGGAGGLGGRGADGGDGGNGGAGGKGGNASDCHTASKGGDGGPGGNGGDGGNGGPGGDGGDGGNGGSVTVLKKEGGFAAPTVITNGGGKGGEPGMGGERGEGGKFGEGGMFGYGGDGDCGFFGCDVKIDPKGPGGQGMAGYRGQNGRPGQNGPMGTPGKDGQNGRIGDGFTQNITEDQLNKLLKVGQ